MEKRGQSQIITTVLIVLLVLVAIIVVWNVVKKVVIEGSEQVDIEILTVDTEIKPGTIYLNQTSEELQFNLKRNPDKVNITGFKVILICDNGLQENYFINSSQLIKSLETETYYIKGFICACIKEINIYPVSSTGKIGIKETYSIANCNQDTSPEGGWDNSTTINPETTTGTCTPQTYYLDFDGDGYGNQTNSTELCDPVGSYTTLNNTDCNDNNSTINPGETEICYNLIDNNCDGIPDNCINLTDLVSWWSMETDTSETISIDKIYMNNGTIFGATPIPGKPGLGQAMKFHGGTSGADHIEVTGIAEQLPTANYSLCWWINPDSLIGLGEIIILGINYNIHNFEYYENGASLDVRANNGGLDDMNINNIFNIGNWIHICGIGNDTGTFVYTNGVLSASNMTAQKSYIAGHNLSIGAYPDGGYGFNGSIDEVILFKRPLTPAEITILATG